MMCPRGAVKRDNEEVFVERDRSEIDEINTDSYFISTFAKHPKFADLQAVDVASRLQLASIYAATSSSLPEEGMNMTCFEMAIQQVRKS